MKKLTILTAVILAATTSLQAQQIDENEVLSLFEAQKNAFSAVREGGTMKTRGLTLVTVDDAEPATVTEVDESLVPLTGTGGDTAAAQVAPSVPGAETVTFGRLDPELQVNLFIKFEFDSASIGADQRPTLDQMCTVMRDSDIEVFQIVGHTDTSGSEDYNEQLSRLRAEEVARYLVSSCQIAPTRLSTLGLGERFPINDQDTRADENRRVEFQALS